MRRRDVLVGCAGVVVALVLPRVAAGEDAAYAAIADWLFDLYLERSIQLSVFNVQRVRPGADQLLTPKLPAMVQVLGRHRSAFVEAMNRALRQHLPPADASALAGRVATRPVALDDATRSTLVAVDSEFRRESQSVIRALTADLGGMIEDALGAPVRAN